MKTFKRFVLTVLTVVIPLVALDAQTILEPAVLQKVQGSVFEVVVKKPEDDGLEYEKPLPLDRIPYAIRTDKYLPIGTAFLMTDGRFYTAAHVFALYEDTLYPDFYIRDINGKTWKVDSIVKFSTDRDFVCFTAEGYVPAQGSGLVATGDIQLNSSVFSVGNALGEGIVIRNGVLTSQTPEQENGAWKWLRFSAAASPGNSGGPLVTADGKVLGIVAMKSENENLNYALPLSEMNAVPDNTGIVHAPFYYTLPNITTGRFYFSNDSTVTLPEKFQTVREKVTAAYKKRSADAVAELAQKYSISGTQGFAVSDGAPEMLSGFYAPDFPYTMYLSESNKWSYAVPNDLSDHQLEKNGNVRFGGMMGYTLAYITKPDDIPLEKLLSEPKLYMDYLLTADRMTRNVGGENVAITSFGRPCISEKHVDDLGRTWLVNYWKVVFTDYMVISYALPLPDGVYLMVKVDSTSGVLGGHSLDMAFISSFVYPSYKGQLKNWKEYLALPEEIAGKKSSVVSQLAFSYGNGKASIAAGMFSFDIPSSLVAFDDTSTLRISTGYIYDGTKTSQEVRALEFYNSTRADNYRYVSVMKCAKPGTGAQKNTTERYEQKQNGVVPYNAQPYDSDQTTSYDKTLYPQGFTYETRADAPFVCVLSLELPGQGKNDEMKSFAAETEKAVHLGK